MKRTTSILTLTLLATLLTSMSINAETHVSGAVRGTWTVNNSPYIADGGLTVSERDTLTIEPGVTVRFSGRYAFEIEGIMIAEGTEADSIFFVASNAGPDAWIGLMLSSGRASNCRIAYCSVKHAYRGIEFNVASPKVTNSSFSIIANNGLRLEGSRAEFENCNISNINGSGIAADEDSRLVVNGCTIYSCDDHGISVVGESQATITNCYIRGMNDHGINLNDANQCLVSNNYILGSLQRGISINQSNNIRVERNIIDSSDEVGVWLYRTDDFMLLNNDVLDNGGTGVQIYASSGDIIGNIIASNTQDGILSQGSNPGLDYNCVWNNQRYNYNGISAGENDINENPMLDENLVPIWGGFPDSDSLKSPCIDAGNQQYHDPDGTRSDIGAKFFNQNLPPVIFTTSPEPFDRIDGDQEIEFICYAEDPNDHQITYTWYVNEVEEGVGNIITISFNRDDDYVVRVVVDDGFYLGQTSYEWSFRMYGSYVDDGDKTFSSTFELSAAYPNPFNSATRIELITAKYGTTTIHIFDLWGRHVGEIWNGVISPGRKSFIIDAANLPAGNYFVIAQIGSQSLKRQLTVIK